jgi:hypothetical protein
MEINLSNCGISRFYRSNLALVYSSLQAICFSMQLRDDAEFLRHQLAGKARSILDNYGTHVVVLTLAADDVRMVANASTFFLF